MAKSHKKKNTNKQPANNNLDSWLSQPQNAGQVYDPHAYNTSGQDLKVDSWRSYRNDSTNLQALSGALPSLNATAQEFVPHNVPQHASQSTFSQYQPLRISNGLTERAAIDVTGRKTTVGFAARYPSRQIIAAQDEPLPSIEDGSNYNPHPFIEAVKQIQDKYQPPTVKVRKIKSAKVKAGEQFRAITPAKTASPPPPQITDSYLAEASKLPIRSPESKRLLVILDLNGTLLLRKKASSMSNPIMRPGVTPLLDYLFRNHAVMIYTSAMPESAARMINFFLHPSQRQQLVAVWARDKLDLDPAQFRNKVQVYKKLEKIWNDKSIQKTAGPSQQWNQSNTVLIDDSKLKALAQPYNLLQIPEYTKDDLPPVGGVQNKKLHADLNKIQIDIMKGVELKLEELRRQDNVSRLIRMWRSGETAIPACPGEKVVIQDSQEDKIAPDSCLELVEDDEDGSTKVQHRTDHLPTPQSMVDEDEIARQIRSLREDSEDSTASTGQPANRSVSPITEAVFRELLEGAGK